MPALFTPLPAAFRGALLGALGLLGTVVGFHLSERHPGLPVADAMAVIGSAFEDEPPRFSELEARLALRAAHWYRQAILPALAGVFLGLGVGLWRRLTAPETLTATVTYLALHGLLFGLQGATWVGLASFMCTLAGANSLLRELARLAGSRRSPRREAR